MTATKLKSLFSALRAARPIDQSRVFYVPHLSICSAQTLAFFSQFGSMDMGIDRIDRFLGADDFPSVDLEYGDRAEEVASIRARKIGVDSRDIKLHVLHHQRAMATR